jgi:hypothetical protein
MPICRGPKKYKFPAPFPALRESSRESPDPEFPCDGWHGGVAPGSNCSGGWSDRRQGNRGKTRGVPFVIAGLVPATSFSLTFQHTTWSSDCFCVTRDGVYVVRSPVPAAELDDTQLVGAYKSLSQV